MSTAALSPSWCPAVTALSLLLCWWHGRNNLLYFDSPFRTRAQGVIYIVLDARVYKARAEQHRATRDNLASQSHFRIAPAEQKHIHAENLMTPGSSIRGDVCASCDTVTANAKLRKLPSVTSLSNYIDFALIHILSMPRKFPLLSEPWWSDLMLQFIIHLNCV